MCASWDEGAIVRYLTFILLLPPLACSETPEEAMAHTVQVSTGLQRQGGVLLGETHVVTPLAIVERFDLPTVIDQSGEEIESRVVRRDSDHGVALILIKKKLSGANLGASTEVAEGATVLARVIDADGETHDMIGTTSGYRYHKSTAYLQTDIEIEKEHIGAGVFTAGGELIGILALPRGKMSYVLPIEYIQNGKEALSNHHELRRAIGVGRDSAEFATQRAEADKHPEELPDPMGFNEIGPVHSFSRTALIGELTMLAKKDQPLKGQRITFEVELLGDERRTVAEGPIHKSNLRWVPAPDLVAAISTTQEAAFGKDYVAREIEPYDLGFLYFRVPYAPFCAKIKGGGFSALTLSFEDGRSTDEMKYSDLANVCAGKGSEIGTTLEAEWGFKVKAVDAKDKKKAGKKKKKKKKKRR